MSAHSKDIPTYSGWLNIRKGTSTVGARMRIPFMGFPAAADFDCDAKRGLKLLRTHRILSVKWTNPFSLVFRRTSAPS